MKRLHLFSFRAFFTLFTGAKSTRWPGASYFAIHLLFFCLLIAIALFAVNLALGITLLHLGNKVVCRDYDEKLGHENALTALPVTFANRDVWEKGRINYLSIHANRRKSEISVASFATPLLIVHIMLVHIFLHFRGISNRVGMLFATSLIILFIVVNAQDHWLDIDASKLHKEYTWCWRSNEEMNGLWAERRARWRLLVAGEVLSGMAGLCFAFYFVLAIIAATTNRSHSQQPFTRLQNLRPVANSNTNDNVPDNVNAPSAELPSIRLSPPFSIRIPTSSSSAANTPANKPPVTIPQTTAKRGAHTMTEAEKREREHMEANGKEDENPFRDPDSPVRDVQETGVAMPGAAVQDPKKGKWRKDRAR